VKRTIHLRQSVEGALRNWTRKEWEDVARDNGMGGPDYAKWEFENMKRNGIKYLPIGGPCEGFSHETGCPGHETGCPGHETGEEARP
jgi:hypothetical protein